MNPPIRYIRLRSELLLALGLLALSASPTPARLGFETAPSPSTWTIEASRSTFAVVTHKEGLASGLAHEHLIVATNPRMTLVFDPYRPTATSCSVEVDVVDFSVDDPERQQTWQDEFLERGVLREPFSDLSNKDRDKIRKSMLGKAQLDAEHHPTVRAELRKLRREADEGVAQLEVIVKERSSVREVRFPWPDLDGTKEFEITTGASYTFGDFGIKPYSALLGAIRVADAFDVVIRVVVRPSAN